MRVAVRLGQERNKLLDAKVQWCLLQLLLTEERQHLHVKGRQLPVVQEMLTAIIDAQGWFGPGVSCAEEAKRFPIAFADFAKKAKVAAGISLFLLLFITLCPILTIIRR